MLVNPSSTAYIYIYVHTRIHEKTIKGYTERL